MIQEEHMNDNGKVTIILTENQAHRLLHLYGWACDQNDSRQPWWDIYHEVARQIDRQTHA